MFNMFSHPATRFTCRHCGKDAGYDPEICFFCGPICEECFESPGPCPGEKKHQEKQAEKEREVKHK